MPEKKGKEKEKRITRSGAKPRMFLTTHSNDLKKKGVQMMAKGLSCIIYFCKNSVCTPLSLSYMGDSHHSPWSQTYNLSIKITVAFATGHHIPTLTGLGN